MVVFDFLIRSLFLSFDVVFCLERICYLASEKAWSEKSVLILEKSLEENNEKKEDKEDNDPTKLLFYFDKPITVRDILFHTGHTVVEYKASTYFTTPYTSEPSFVPVETLDM